MSDYPKVYGHSSTGMYWFLSDEHTIWGIDDDVFFISSLMEQDLIDDEEVFVVKELHL